MIAMVDIPESEMRNFESAIKEYYHATGKDAAYVTNRQALNVAIKTGMNTPVADQASIKALPSKSWWPAFVQARLKQKTAVRVRTSKNYKGRKYVIGSATKEELRKVSAKLVRNRQRKAGYIKSGWLPAINALSALKLSMKGRIGKTPRFSKDPSKQPGFVTIAREAIAPVAEIINAAPGIGEVGVKALVQGISLAAADMRQYVREKYGQTAKKFSR